ncbi:putative serine/threonine-protein kinase putative protein kinase [Leptomonas seymouri]|uniref:Protein kinase domain-containing protein n=1 Tax=Leptomonas seymouri TaxID=5684 RepID=A0A0N0P6T0_LEPSE|nr:putative serine/threonine-protein kinase putative protein kinase [Leptomonas seymouri]|eukprot:KPI87527.1 putative serine/threonine-protein kinase putative protein kinase [Leptomonas seymouri]
MLGTRRGCDGVPVSPPLEEVPARENRALRSSSPQLRTAVKTAVPLVIHQHSNHSPKLRLREEHSVNASYPGPIKEMYGSAHALCHDTERLYAPAAKRTRADQPPLHEIPLPTQSAAFALSAAAHRPASRPPPSVAFSTSHRQREIAAIRKQMVSVDAHADADPTDFSRNGEESASSQGSSADLPHSPTSELLAATATNSPTDYPAPPPKHQRIRQHELHASDFQHEEVLGEGSYSLVSLATHRASGLLFALKEIDRVRVQCLQLESQLQWEINVQRTLRHPNMVRLYSYFITPSCISLVLEYCRGGTLLHQLKAAPHGRLTEQQASRYTRHVAKALAYLHDLGVAHRDLKLENVLIDEDGVAKLADFGWSRPVGSCHAHPKGAEKDQDLMRAKNDETEGQAVGATHAAGCDALEVHQTRDNNMREDGELEGRRTVCGTLDYLSPEMVSGQTHTFKTDVWSLGVMLVEMLTGVPPFYKDSTQQTLHAIRFETPNLCGASSQEKHDCPVLSAGALSLIDAMLQKDPARRPSMRELLHHPWLQKRMYFVH